MSRSITKKIFVLISFLLVVNILNGSVAIYASYGVNSPNIYSVKQGDNLWNIIKNAIAAGNHTDNEKELEIKTNDLKNKLKKVNESELRKIGFSTGRIERLFVGDMLDFNSFIKNNYTEYRDNQKTCAIQQGKYDLVISKISIWNKNSEVITNRVTPSEVFWIKPTIKNIGSETLSSDCIYYSMYLNSNKYTSGSGKCRTTIITLQPGQEIICNATNPGGFAAGEEKTYTYKLIVDDNPGKSERGIIKELNETNNEKEFTFSAKK